MSLFDLGARITELEEQLAEALFENEGLRSELAAMDQDLGDCMGQLADLDNDGELIDPDDDYDPDADEEEDDSE